MKGMDGKGYAESILTACAGDVLDEDLHGLFLRAHARDAR